MLNYGFWKFLKTQLGTAELSAMKKPAVRITLIAVLGLSLLVSIAAADNGVAVQAGDWIEYNVTTTGNPTPIHNITWARLDVKTVTGSEINTDIQTRLANGTLWLEPNTTFNVATGAVGEGAIIPTNLTVGRCILQRIRRQHNDNRNSGATGRRCRAVGPHRRSSQHELHVG